MAEKKHFTLEAKQKARREAKLKWQSTHREEEKEYKRQHAKMYIKTEKGKQAIYRALRKDHLKHKIKWDARVKLRHAVKMGRIIKPDHCEQVNLNDPTCGKIEAHHYLGYEGIHWADVQWLCRKHHFEAHRKLKEDITQS